MQLETILQNSASFQNKSKIQRINQLTSACGINSLLFVRAGHRVHSEFFENVGLSVLNLFGNLPPGRSPNEQP